MSFGIDGGSFELPYVKLKGTKFGEITAFPKWKYHAVDAPEGIIVEDAGEEAALGSGWVDSPAALGIETAPTLDKIQAAKRGRKAKVAA